MKKTLACFFLSVLITASSIKVHANEPVNPIAARSAIPLSGNGATRRVSSRLGQFPAKRRRRKRHIAWEQAELSSNGLYARNLQKIAVQFPTLSPMEQRVCALVKAGLPNWKAGELLGICEKTVENHLRGSRLRLGLPPGTRLATFLASEQSYPAAKIELSSNWGVPEGAF